MRWFVRLNKKVHRFCQTLKIMLIDIAILALFTHELWQLLHGSLV